MPQHDFRAQAALACEGILVATGLKRAGRTPTNYEPGTLAKDWSTAISCITESTLVTVTNKGDPDFAMLRKLYCSEVLFPLHSLILDYPAPSVPKLTPAPATNTIADLDVGDSHTRSI